MEYYYPSDSEVSADYELQEWITEIFNYGFLGKHDSGILWLLYLLRQTNQVSCVYHPSFIFRYEIIFNH